MTSPPLSPKPRTAIPYRLVNGSSAQHVPSEGKERDNLIASINRINNGRELVDLDGSLNLLESPGLSGPNAARPRPVASSGVSRAALTHSHPHLTEAARDPRDEASPSTVSRPESPYTQNPPIDFDGLSWPSESVKSTEDLD